MKHGNFRSISTFTKLVCSLTFLFAVRALSTAAEKPDIVFILADDLGSYDVSWRGSEIKTPNLDKLAARGAKLEQFYVQPVCSPTRSSLLTGRYPMRYGLQVGVIRPWANYGLSLEERTLPQALREVGYTTAICGKWHLGSFDKSYWPNARGFDKFYGHLFGALDYYKHDRDGKFDWYRDGEPNHDLGYTTHLVGNEAVRILHGQPKNKPLFLYVPFNAVHAPLQVPENYKVPYANLLGARQTYAGMVAALDEMVGQIVAAVDETGRRKNTLFIFSSDNGGPRPGVITSNGPFEILINATPDGGAIRVGDWKLVVNGNKNDFDEEKTEDKVAKVNAKKKRDQAKVQIELFDLENDPYEKLNLAETKPEKVKDLQVRYDVYARQAVRPKNAK